MIYRTAIAGGTDTRSGRLWPMNQKHTLNSVPVAGARNVSFFSLVSLIV